MKVNFVKYIFIIIVTLLIIVAVYIIYNNKSGSNEAKNIKENITNVDYQTSITMGISNYDNINPIITNNKEIINISKLIFEPLISVDENYKINFCLAKECAKLSDTSYLIKIDTQIKWQDGTYLKSEDVEFTINKIKERNSIYSDNVAGINEIQVIDESGIKIDLNNSDPFFEYKLVFPIMQKNSYIDDNFFESSKTPIGTGMYKITDISGDKILLEQNEYYRENKEELKIKKIEILIYENIGQVYNGFKIGSVDIFNTSNIFYKESLGILGYRVKEYEGRNADFLALNLNSASLSELEVRKAINTAIDKRKINQTVYNGQYEVINSPTNYGSYKIDNESEIIANKEYASNILKNAGYSIKNGLWQKKDNNGRRIYLSFNLVVKASDEVRGKVAELIKKDLNEIGIQINLLKVSDNRYLEYLQNKNYDIILTGINNGVNTNYNYFYGDNNLGNYSNQEIKTIINEISNVKDEKILKEKYNELYRLIEEEQPYIGLYRDKSFLIINSKVHGEFNPNNYSLFNNIWTWYKL